MSNAGYSKNGSKVNPLYNNSYNDRYFGSSNFFSDILLILFDNKQIDLRNLLKLEKVLIPLNDGNLFKDNLNQIFLSDEEFPILIFLRLFCIIKGNSESFKQSINKISGQSLDAATLGDYITKLLYLNTLIEHKSKRDVIILYEIMGEKVELIIDKEGKYKINKYNEQPIPYNNSHLFWLIGKAIDLLKSQNML